MTASTEGHVLRRAFAVALFTLASFAVAHVFAGMVTPVSAQTPGGEPEDGNPTFTFRNDVSMSLGSAWQTLIDVNIFGPDEHVLDRSDWSFGLRYTHVFTDLPQDDAHRHDVSRRLLRSGHVAVAVTDGPVQAMEPDEFRLNVSATRMVAPSVALGGRFTQVYTDGMLYRRWDRERYSERAQATMLALLADIWLSPRVVFRESIGGGVFTREGAYLRTPENGPVFCFGHELLLGVNRTVSYSHTLRVEFWKDYHRVYDLINRVEIALHPQLVGSAGLRAAHFYTEEFTNETALGLLASVRYHPIPELYAEASASMLAALLLFDSRHQREFHLALGARF